MPEPGGDLHVVEDSPAAPRSVTAVIPALNEAGSVGTVVQGLRAKGWPWLTEVIVVDDGSSDETAARARETGARVITHPGRRGYGAALKTGIRAACTEVVVCIDGDGQHDPADVAELIRHTQAHDLVIGRRRGVFHSQAWRMPGKWLIHLIAVYLVGQRIPDLNSGLRAFRMSAIRKYLHLCPDGFSFSTTTTVAFLNRGLRVTWVPITVSARAGRSAVTVYSGLETLLLMMRLLSLFEPMRVFLPLSALLGAAGVLWGVPYAAVGNGVSVGALLLLVSAMLLFSLGLLLDQISALRKERFE